MKIQTLIWAQNNIELLDQEVRLIEGRKEQYDIQWMRHNSGDCSVYDRRRPEPDMVNHRVMHNFYTILKSINSEVLDLIPEDRPPNTRLDRAIASIEYDGEHIDWDIKYYGDKLPPPVNGRSYRYLPQEKPGTKLVDRFTILHYLRYRVNNTQHLIHEVQKIVDNYNSQMLESFNN